MLWKGNQKKFSIKPFHDILRGDIGSSPIPWKEYREVGMPSKVAFFLMDNFFGFHSHYRKIGEKWKDSQLDVGAAGQNV